MNEQEKIATHKENIKKYIDRLYATTSVNAEANITEDLIKEIKKLEIDDLVDLANTLDVFGKCVLHYRLPIDYRMNVDFSNATKVEEEDRISFWKDYKTKLLDMKKGPEEEYDKIILMACTLHVPISEPENENVESVNET